MRELLVDTTPEDGIATCSHVHRWPVVWFWRTERVTAAHGTYPVKFRVVKPAECPTCGDRYDQIEGRPA